jgi:hypothetical protein
MLMVENYNPFTIACSFQFWGQSRVAMDINLHSVSRHLIELKIAHADLDDVIDRMSIDRPDDELGLRRLKKQRLKLRDQIHRLEADLDPPEPA